MLQGVLFDMDGVLIDSERFICKAAGELELKPENCLVVEDAVSGVNAAKAAGMRCLALLTSFNKKDLKGSDWIVQNLKSVPEEVLNW